MFCDTFKTLRPSGIGQSSTYQKMPVFVFAVSIERSYVAASKEKRRKKKKKRRKKKEVGGIRRISFKFRVAYPLTVFVYVYGPKPKTFI